MPQQIVGPAAPPARPTHVLVPPRKAARDDVRGPPALGPHRLSRRVHRPRVPQRVADHQGRSGRRSLRHQRLGIRHRERERDLDENVPAGRECRLRLLCVDLARRRDDDSLDTVGGDGACGVRLHGRDAVTARELERPGPVSGRPRRARWRPPVQGLRRGSPRSHRSRGPRRRCPARDRPPSHPSVLAWPASQSSYN